MLPNKKKTASNNGTGMKQGNLFSFFALKPKGAASTRQAPSLTPKSNGTPSAASAPSKTTPLSRTSQNREAAVVSTSSKRTSKRATNDKSSNSNAELIKKVKVGVRIAVYWPDDRQYYSAVVKKEINGRFELAYDDGEMEWTDLRNERFRLIYNDDGQVDDSDDEDDNVSDDKATAASGRPKKRPRIHESDDEEFEMDDVFDEESDGSVFEAAEEEDDDADDWLVSDEDDELVVKGKAKRKAPAASKKKTAVEVTKHQTAATGANDSPAQFTPKPFTSSNNTAGSSFSKQGQGSYSTTVARATPKRVTPTSAPRNLHMDSADNGKALPYVADVVNPGGSHVHNHLEFLKNPRDAKGRTRDHPDYDCRTLKVDQIEFQKHLKGKKWSPGVQQWWETKAQYFDTVLLFKTGKFYEMFHMDADIGVEALGFSYMKGIMAHAGFPEISYGCMADKLVRAGYKVARVEQTETPEMLKDRKKRLKGSSSVPKVVNREVCSILTMGTRTFCYLDQDGREGLSKELTIQSGSGHAGPLLAIREILLEAESSDGNEDEVRPVCEYGVFLVDASTAECTLGQFADDVLRSRMHTLLTAFAPSEVLVGGADGASPTLLSLLETVQMTSSIKFRVEKVQNQENFPKSTAIDVVHRRQLERGRVEPWNVQETIKELHRKGYYPRGSREKQDESTSRWPAVLRAAIEGGADLALASLGAALFYLQRNLIDEEILSMGIVKAYVPPASSAADRNTALPASESNDVEMNPEPNAATTADMPNGARSNRSDFGSSASMNDEENISHMSIDGNTLCQLEVLANSVDHKVAGSLWSKINHTKTPHGARLLRAWLLRPLFRKEEIDRRADAVEELVSGSPACALNEAASCLQKCGDIERLLARIHSMSGTGADGEPTATAHPAARAVLYEGKQYTKRKLGDFSRVISGLRHASRIPDIFSAVEIESGLLTRIVRLAKDGGCFPDMTDELDWFSDHFENFEMAKKGEFEPGSGVDEAYDEACLTIEQITSRLADYKKEMCANVLTNAKSSWKYINTAPDSKDKYTIELPSGIRVPADFEMIGKRGSGAKQINKYKSSYVEAQVKLLERAWDVQKERKAIQMQSFFAKFDAKRSLWAAAAQATALLDALGSLAKTAERPGYCRPTILDCPRDTTPCIRIVQGKHPCVESTANGGEFIPNDIVLGGQPGEDSPTVLLLSGPNMGGKSTLLRTVSLTCILAQIGSFVPAETAEITPVDKIFTRLGASDRILCGQSTFFVELAETAAALRGATRRSLAIFDELGRGTSTFDGTAIASAAVAHLVERTKCLCVFATHYHSLLDEWKADERVRLAHMESIVNEDGNDKDVDNITFLYTLGDGACPKSFGINVARLARLPDEVLEKAKRISSDFEAEMSGAVSSKLTTDSALQMKQQIESLIQEGNVEKLEKLWDGLQN